MALVLTKKGLELLQKLQVGEIPAVEFSDVAVGDGLWASSDINLDIAALKSVRIKTGIGSKKTTTRGEDTIVTISATLNNENITESFYVREVGLYAKDGESEILYAYDIIPENETAQAVVQSNIVPQYIPIMLDTALSNIDAVNITVTDDINFVITSEFEEYKEDTAETISNLKTELQSKIDEANELIIALGSVIDSAKSEITTAYTRADNAITQAYKQADTALQTAINGKAASNHNHNDIYFTEAEINTKLNKKANTNHNHDSQYVKIGANADIQCIEFKTSDTSNHGGYIDFHFNGSTKDWTTRIIEEKESYLNIEATKGIKMNGKEVVNADGDVTAEVLAIESSPNAINGSLAYYCYDSGLTVAYANPEHTGDINNNNKLTEPVICLNLSSPHSDRKVQLAVGTDSCALYVRTARTPFSSGSGVWQYGVWRRI